MYIFLYVRKNYKYNKFFTQIANILRFSLYWENSHTTDSPSVIKSIAKSKFFEYVYLIDVKIFNTKKYRVNV
jgi:hypothetical protein